MVLMRFFLRLVVLVCALVSGIDARQLKDEHMDVTARSLLVSASGYKVEAYKGSDSKSKNYHEKMMHFHEKYNDASSKKKGSSNKKAQKFHEKRVEYQQKYKAALAKHSKKHDDK
mmetsp:Transcript_4045/g.7841  ORF Transcript_4045/g.7841 Transcript_4045/m.7841 type:complete len:115 (-) Transcript_4045:583-927(-)|eukprot:CAMPEP_0114249864 /NCGR_PEP_ID=MMETSP0058-20121206/14387_1 /TAXON_ID=36894 /ORGANISM="Pyramimonas parkeae, CCMP726" /LENGTH=114 /DNA_ID=CAMNT_0001363473 /DNA_START=85 /DNA_END=429 /DNA_ORIENTATION=-